MYLGCDISLTGTGLILLDVNSKVLIKEVLTTKTFGTERLFHLENLFSNILDTVFDQIKLVCIESPAYGVSEGNLFNIGEITGIFKLYLYKKGLKVIYAAPSQVKKYCTGKGKGNKDLILLKTYQNFGEEFASSDLADGYILARIALDYYHKYILNKELEVKKYQIEVLKKINKTEEEEKSQELLK